MKGCLLPFKFIDDRLLANLARIIAVEGLHYHEIAGLLIAGEMRLAMLLHLGQRHFGSRLYGHHRGHGLGTWLVDTIVATLTDAGLQRFVLATRDAHGVYRKSGFAPLEGAQRFMEIDRRPTKAAILADLS